MGKSAVHQCQRVPVTSIWKWQGLLLLGALTVQGARGPDLWNAVSFEGLTYNNQDVEEFILASTLSTRDYQELSANSRNRKEWEAAKKAMVEEYGFDRGVAELVRILVLNAEAVELRDSGYEGLYVARDQAYRERAAVEDSYLERMGSREFFGAFLRTTFFPFESGFDSVDEVIAAWHELEFRRIRARQGRELADTALKILTRKKIEISHGFSGKRIFQRPSAQAMQWADAREKSEFIWREFRSRNAELPAADLLEEFQEHAVLPQLLNPPTLHLVDTEFQLPPWHLAVKDPSLAPLLEDQLARILSPEWHDGLLKDLGTVVTLAENNDKATLEEKAATENELGFGDRQYGPLYRKHGRRHWIYKLAAEFKGGLLSTEQSLEIWIAGIPAQLRDTPPEVSIHLAIREAATATQPEAASEWHSMLWAYVLWDIETRSAHAHRKLLAQFASEFLEPFEESTEITREGLQTHAKAFTEKHADAPVRAAEKRIALDAENFARVRHLFPEDAPLDRDNPYLENFAGDAQVGKPNQWKDPFSYSLAYVFSHEEATLREDEDLFQAIVYYDTSQEVLREVFLEDRHAALITTRDGPKDLEWVAGVLGYTKPRL